MWVWLTKRGVNFSYIYIYIYILYFILYYNVDTLVANIYIQLKSGRKATPTVIVA